jgi:hypothetical protein
MDRRWSVDILQAVSYAFPQTVGLLSLKAGHLASYIVKPIVVVHSW